MAVRFYVGHEVWPGLPQWHQLDFLDWYDEQQKEKQMNSRDKVFELINDERRYQDARWHAAPHTPTEWLVYMQSYVTSAMQDAAQFDDPDLQIMAAIRKITAMGVAAMEQHETPERRWKV